MSKVVIIAPHCDDEIIGNYEVIANEMIKPIIVYTEPMSETRQKEALKLKDYDLVSIQFFQRSIPPQLIDPRNTLYFPDPVYEIHPAHRKWGSIGEQVLRSKNNVIFYSVNMQAPYIHEISIPEEKERLLNKIYSSQSSMWEFENKYFLFEGRCKWIF